MELVGDIHCRTAILIRFYNPIVFVEHEIGVSGGRCS